MTAPNPSPWLPPPAPDLTRLAWEAADGAGIAALARWPVASRGGLAFGDLPPFLCWQGFQGGHHVMLFQPRELGALVPGARTEPLPAGWLEALDLEDLARPLACHPDFPGGASVQVVHVMVQGRMGIRTRGQAAPRLVAAALERLTGISGWILV